MVADRAPRSPGACHFGPFVAPAPANSSQSGPRLPPAPPSGVTDVPRPRPTRHAQGAPLRVAVGTHWTLAGFRAQGRQGIGSTFLTGLGVVGKLVDPKGVSRLYRSRVSTCQLVLFVLATMVAMAAAFAVSTAGQAYGALVSDQWHDLLFWFSSRL